MFDKFRKWFGESGSTEELRDAVRKADPKRVASLIDGGVAVDAREESQGWTALHFAVLAERVTPAVLECVKTLLARGADPNAPSVSGETPLLRAARIVPDPPRLALVELLLEKGGDPGRRDESGVAPIHVAVGTVKARFERWFAEKKIETPAPPESEASKLARLRMPKTVRDPGRAVEALRAFGERLEAARASDPERIVVDPPLTAEELTAIEGETNVTLPHDLRWFLCNVTARFKGRRLELLRITPGAIERFAKVDAFLKEAKKSLAPELVKGYARTFTPTAAVRLTDDGCGRATLLVFGQRGGHVFSDERVDGAGFCPVHGEGEGGARELLDFPAWLEASCSR